MNSMKKMTGSEFIKMMRPILGIESVRGIVGINIRANIHEVTTLEIETIPDIDLEGVTVDECDDAEPNTKRYIVTVRPAPDE